MSCLPLIPYPIAGESVIGVGCFDESTENVMTEVTCHMCL